MQKGLEKTAKKVGEVAKTMVKAFTLPVAALTALTIKTVAYADEIATTAQKINMSAEALQKWQYIAMQTDVETERLTKAFTKYREVIGNRLLGNTNNATKALDELNISMASLDGKSAEQSFEILIGKLSSIKDPVLQAAYANRIFGERVATDLIPLLEAGSEAIEKYGREFEKTGYLTNEQVKQLAEFDNKMNQVKQSIKVASANLGQAFLPILENLLSLVQTITPYLQKVANFFSNLPEPVQKVTTATLLFLAALGPLLSVYQKLILLKAIIVGWYKAATIAKIVHTAAVSAETAQQMANNAAQNAGLLTMIKSIAVYAASKVAIVAKTVAMGAYIAAVKVATAAQWLLNKAFIATPIGWIVLGIGALVTAFVLLWQKCEGFRNFWINLWDAIKLAFKVTVNYIISGINTLLNGLKIMTNGAIDIVNGMIKALNKVPGIDIKLIPKLDENALQIPKLASGGIAYGNAIVNVGEYANARNNPEVIAPLDKLKDMIGTENTSISIYIDNDLITRKVIKRLPKDLKLRIG